MRHMSWSSTRDTIPGWARAVNPFAPGADGPGGLLLGQVEGIPKTVEGAGIVFRPGSRSGHIRVRRNRFALPAAARSLKVAAETGFFLVLDRDLSVLSLPGDPERRVRRNKNACCRMSKPHPPESACRRHTEVVQQPCRCGAARSVLERPACIDGQPHAPIVVPSDEQGDRRQPSLCSLGGQTAERTYVGNPGQRSPTHGIAPARSAVRFRRQGPENVTALE